MCTRLTTQQSQLATSARKMMDDRATTPKHHGEKLHHPTPIVKAKVDTIEFCDAMGFDYSHEDVFNFVGHTWL